MTFEDQPALQFISSRICFERRLVYKLSYDKLLYQFAFNFNLGRYSTGDLFRMLDKCTVGQSIAMKIMRGADKFDVTVTLDDVKDAAGRLLRISTRRSNNPRYTSTPHQLITCQLSGTGVIENTHSTDVESPPLPLPPRVCVSIGGY
jgi:hypothetical protein